jgi:hypothetical protein
VERRELSDHERVRGALMGLERRSEAQTQDAGLVQCRKKLDRGTTGRTVTARTRAATRASFRTRVDEGRERTHKEEDDWRQLSVK